VLPSYGAANTLPISARVNELVLKFSSELSAVHQPYAGSNDSVVRGTGGLHNVGFLVLISFSKELKRVYTNENPIYSTNVENDEHIIYCEIEL
jgi:hypothetical protein